MSYNSDIAVYKTQIDNDISTQSLPNSIPPDVVGSGYTDLADLLAPYINAINNETILPGSTVPSVGIGNDLDLYYRVQPSSFDLYRKESGAWVLKVSVPFGITLPDGPATLRTFISGTTASVTKGGWFINNSVYNKLTQTNFTVPAADATFYRTDLIYADTSNAILYLTGTPSLTPVDPSIPANTVAVDYVIVPSVASGFDPYLRFGSTTESNGIAEQNDTGALTYGGISVASTTTVNIGACTGYVVNNETTPGSPTLTFVNYAGETGKTVTTLGSGIATYVLLSSSGTIVFQNDFPTSAQRKTHIYLSKIAHPAGTITVAGDEVDFVLSPLAQFRDLFQAINYVNDGVYPSANGANLSFNTSAGNIHGNGINFVADNTSPNELPVAPSTPATFLPRTRTGAGGTATTTIDVGNYDVAGVVTAIPGGANTSTLRYIFCVPNLGFLIQYGQTTYASLTDAIAAVGKESSFVIYPSLTNNAILIGVLAATKSATALNNTAQAQFFRADKFGQIIGAQAGVSVGTMQNSYDNSLQPQVLTDATRGAVQFKRGSAADTDNVFQILDGAGTGRFGINGLGDVATNGVIRSTVGAEVMKVGTNTGNPDHAYIGLYARTATPTTLSGSIGYLTAATSNLTVKNEISGGALILNTLGAGFVMNTTNFIQLNVTNSGNTNTARIRFGDPGTTSSNIIYSESFFTSHSNGSELRLINGGGTISAVTAIASGNSLGLVQLGGYTTSATQYNSVAVKGVATEAWSSTAGGSKLDFYTTPNGTVAQSLALTIDQDGSLVHAGSRSGTATKWLGVDSTGKVVDAATIYNYSATYDVPSLAAGAVDAQTVSVPGCLLGDFVIASMDTPLGHYLTLKAYVSTNGSVDVVFHNTSTGTIDLVSGTLRLKVIR